MEYVLIKIDFHGNDDIHFQGLVATQATSLQDVKTKIQDNIVEEFSEEGYIEVYSSDNDSTTFDSEKNLLNTISCKNITKEEFETLQKLLDTKGNRIEYGHVPSFLDYEPPAPTKKAKIK